MKTEKDQFIEGDVDYANKRDDKTESGLQYIYTLVSHMSETQTEESKPCYENFSKYNNVFDHLKTTTTNHKVTYFHCLKYIFSRYNCSQQTTKNVNFHGEKSKGTE